ncbi:hypothetical protein Lepto7375DRAFT_7410 [Leptolyngbya sp. PCC 7375]|nr:hypothetical protein Lepto7375DRAFT_7410 [Leptolyngbya sp. PCC 7375]
MTKEQKAKALIEAIYNATQKGVSVKFSKDFTGQMTLSLGDVHTHVGTPGGDFDQMVEGATRFINGSVDPIVEERERIQALSPLDLAREIRQAWGIES